MKNDNKKENDENGMRNDEQLKTQTSGIYEMVMEVKEKMINGDINVDDIEIENESLRRACEQVKWLKEAIVYGIIQVVPLFPDTAQEKYQKRPMVIDGESWTEHVYTIEELNTRFRDSNFGIKLGKPSFYLCCIDIDGFKGAGLDVMIRSREYFHDVFKEYFPYYDQCIVVQTSNLGYHIYFLTRPDSPILKKHESSARIMYPDNCPVPEISGKSCKGGYELFDGRKIDENGEEKCNRQTVGWGSIYNGRVYEVISEQNDITMLPVIDNIEEELEKAFLKAGFKPVLDLNNSKFEYESRKSKGTVPIPKENIPIIARHDKKLFEHFHENNCKYYATQAYAGYLYNNTDYESAMLLCAYHVEYFGDLFNDKGLYVDTLLNDFHNPPADGVLAQGGRKFYEDYISDLLDRETYWTPRIFLMGGNLQFFVGDKFAKKINQIILNREKCKVYLNTYVETKINDEYRHVLNTSKEIMGLCPVSLELVSNPLNHNESKLIMKCVSHYGEKVIEANNAESLLDSFKSINGAILNKLHFADVINQIIAKFFEYDMVKKTDKSSLSGVFVIDDELVRYDSHGDNVPINIPYEFELIEALSLVEEVLNVIPHDKGEVGLLLRKYFLYPFHFYFKKNRREVKYITISGTGGTLKSTLAEMILSIYQDIIKSGYESNVIGGGAFDSEYKIANAMSKSTWGFICNEPDSAFGKVELRQILKVATTELSARERNGKKMYSYQSPIFCSNVELPSEPEFLRRIEEFNFSPKCIITEKVKQDLDSILNENGVQNKNFDKLRFIGDFILDFISRNLNLLDELSYDELELVLVDELEKYSGKDLSWLKMTRADLDYSDEFDSFEEYDNIMELFIKELRMVYNRNHNSCILIKDSVKNDYVKEDNYEEAVLINLVQRGYYPFLTLLKSDKNFLIIKDKALSGFFRVNNKAGISGRKFFEDYLSPFGDKYDTMNHGNNRSIDGQVKGTRVPVKFLTDLLNGNAYD